MTDDSVFHENVSLGVFIDFGGVGDDENGFSFFVELCKYLHDIVSGFAIKCPSWFVSEDEEGISDDGSCYCDTLLLSSGHLIGERINLVPETDLDERIYR